LLQPGPTNSIVDVADMSVGHASVWRDEPAPPAGRGTARTGVTVIVPFTPAELFSNRVAAGAAILNGAGEMIGITAIGEWGLIETPIFLTSSMAIGRVYDAAVEALVERIPRAGIDDALMPVVAECDDGYLNASRTVQVDAADVRAALDGARGAAAGPLATDAPLRPNQLSRLARRAGLGLARAGSTGGHGSVEIFVAISTALRSRRGGGPLVSTTHIHDEFLDPFFAAVVEATEEAVIDSLFVADTVVGRDGHRLAGLPVPRVLELLGAAGRLADREAQMSGR
jgi:L-aminopeptidase/D-esterase-like protein